MGYHSYGWVSGHETLSSGSNQSRGNIRRVSLSNASCRLCSFAIDVQVMFLNVANNLEIISY
jgi:hypothetical protein